MPRHATIPLVLALLRLAAACSPDETGSLPPRFEGAALSVAEHSPAGTVVGTLNATVAEGRKASFRLTSGDPDAVFALDAGGRLTVADAQALDFETSPSFTLTVEVTDDATPPGTASGQVVVTLTDVNDAPQLADVTFDLPDDAQAGAVVGALVVVDADAGQTHTFALVGGNTGDTFEVDATSGTLTLASTALLDETSFFTLEVRVTDSGTPALTGEATVTVNIVVSPLVVSGGPFTVDEHTPEGSLVGTLTVPATWALPRSSSWGATRAAPSASTRRRARWWWPTPRRSTSRQRLSLRSPSASPTRRTTPAGRPSWSRSTTSTTRRC